MYAAGVLLFEMLTGRKPHEGEGAIQIAFKHVNEDIVAPSTCTSQPLPSYVDALVTRATSREREHRQADAKVFLQQARRVAATLRAGVVEDEELTADLLPAGPGVLRGGREDGIDYVDEDADTGADRGARRAAAAAFAPSAWTEDTDVDSEDDELDALEDPAARADHEVPLPDSEETTTLIRVGGLAGAGVAGASVGASAAAARSAGTLPSARGTAPPRPSVDRGARGPAARGGVPSSHGGTPPTPPRANGQGRDPRSGVPGQAGSPPAGVASSPGRPPRRRRSRRGLVLLLVVALLTVAAGYAGWWFAVGRYTSTPGVINLAVSDAESKVADAGLDIDIAERVFSETVPAGSIIETDPAAGSRIVEGGTVEAVVSKGRERYAVPALAGKPLDDVEAILAERNLTLGEPTRALQRDRRGGQGHLRRPVRRHRAAPRQRRDGGRQPRPAPRRHPRLRRHGAPSGPRRASPSWASRPASPRRTATPSTRAS